MNTDRLESFLEEWKDGKITSDELVGSPELFTEEEINWLKSHMISHLQNQLNVSDKETLTVEYDPIETQHKIFTWGSIIADGKFSPIEPQNFIIIAGETSSGKTAYSFDLAVKNAGMGNSVLFISLEMTGSQIITRIARSYAGITKAQWRDKSLIGPNQIIAYKNKRAELMSVQNLEVQGFGKGQNPTIKNILSIIEAKRPSLVFVDNFDLITRTDEQLQHEQMLSKSFMDFTNKNKIPIIVLHHTKKTKDKINIDSIRGSGKITDDADAVFICRRNLDYGEDTTPEERALFSVSEIKDRAFGEGGFHNFYFKKGSFYDEFDESTKHFS